jgi:hypothetical protein
MKYQFSSFHFKPEIGLTIDMKFHFYVGGSHIDIEYFIGLEKNVIPSARNYIALNTVLPFLYYKFSYIIV